MSKRTTLGAMYDDVFRAWETHGVRLDDAKEKRMHHSYQSVLQLAGATVKEFQDEGGYEGVWWALVDYEGATFWIKGYFGSCSGCDDMEAMYSDDAKEADYKKYAEGLLKNDRMSHSTALARATDDGDQWAIDLIKKHADAGAGS